MTKYQNYEKTFRAYSDAEDRLNVAEEAHFAAKKAHAAAEAAHAAAKKAYLTTDVATVFYVATVSTQVATNYVANSIPSSCHATIDEARRAADALDALIQSAHEAREDWGFGAIRGEDVIVHDGYECV